MNNVVHLAVHLGNQLLNVGCPIKKSQLSRQPLSVSPDFGQSGIILIKDKLEYKMKKQIYTL